MAAVFGGASGIGAAIAEALATAGYAVHVADLTTAPAVDVTKEEAVSGFLEQTREREGRLDLVVNSAGSSTLGLVTGSSPSTSSGGCSTCASPERSSC